MAGFALLLAIGGAVVQGARPSLPPAPPQQACPGGADGTEIVVCGSADKTAPAPAGPVKPEPPKFHTAIGKAQIDGGKAQGPVGVTMSIPF